jgi:hypothetical protein
MDRDGLAIALFSVAQRRAAAHGVQLGQGADGDIRLLAEAGADQILRQLPQVTSEHPMVKDAQAAFEKLVDEMVRAANEIEGYRIAYPRTIGEQTLAQALSKLCPLFPIC